MSVIKGRRSGAWVNASNQGKVRYEGAWDDFGASAPVLTETLTWPYQPTGVDGVDGSTYYAMGAEFALTGGVGQRDCLGIQWRAPTNTPNPGLPTVNHRVMLYRKQDNSLLASKEFTPVPGQYNNVMFDSPVRLLDGFTYDYVAAVYTWHYVFASPPGAPGTWVVKSPSNNVFHEVSRLGVSNSPPSSSSSLNVFNSFYYVSPIVAVNAP